jgi:endonuclease G
LVTKTDKVVELCNNFYVTVYDESLKSALFSSALVSPKTQPVKRKDAFRPDIRLPVGTRAELSDYRSSHYDRGHLTPAADANNDNQMNATFLLSNMTAQNSKLNEVAWKGLEEKVRKMISANTVIVTGAIYLDKVKDTHTTTFIGKDNIPVPMRYYKIVYLPTGPLTWQADNCEACEVFQSSVQEIIDETGIQFPLN